ncbi:uncharacterized protein LOC132631292 [Lycium barbarum]|uniref:uncharacterized protein LOC132631292 n=1 Tax=Lycium barbarum TaxID=112863 RepID=UPI00293E548B|nr:uncharacterized protein LOC132631292 [Lycium barbarum]
MEGTRSPGHCMTVTTIKLRHCSDLQSHIRIDGPCNNARLFDGWRFYALVLNGPFVPTKTDAESGKQEEKPTKEYIEVDRKVIEKGFKAKKILMCGIGPDEYNRVSSYETAKEIWEALLTAHERISQVKQSKIDMLTTEYELFRMKDDESIQDMHTRFTSIINELHSLRQVIPINKQV